MNTDLISVNDLTRWDADELSEVSARILEVVKSGCFMRGPQTQELEISLGKQLGGMNVVAVGNGTDALVLALMALEVGPGDFVATTANAGGYATGAILRLGATPVLIDVVVTTGQMSSESLLGTIASGIRLKALVVTHLFGLMAEISEIREIAEQFNVLLIEDCAQSFGARLNGVPAGAWGHAATFSFYPTKNLAALGDGGAVAFRTPDQADVCRQLAQYGWSERYVVARRSGINSRLDELQASVLNIRLKRLERQNSKRRAIVSRYSQSIRSPRYFMRSDSDSFVAHLAVLVTPTRDRDIETFHQGNIGTTVHYPVQDHQQPAWKSLFEGLNLPNTEALANSIVSLPCYPNLRNSEIEHICNILSQL